MRVFIAFVVAAAFALPASAVEMDQVGETTDNVVDDILTGAWLDPEDPYWAPRRGQRFELAVLIGGEGALGGFAPDKLPTIGGVVVNGIGRYYPVDRLAVIFGGRAYFGLELLGPLGVTAQEGAPATFSRQVLHTLCLTIAGGTSEVQRNVIGERMLGLPRDPEPAT